MKISNIDREILHYLLNDLRNINYIFREDVTYDNIKSHKKTGLHPLFSRYIFRKTTKGDQIDPPVALGLAFMFFVSFGTHIFGDKTLQLPVDLFKLIMNG